MDLITQLLLKSRIGAYLEWLANELIMTYNKTHKAYHILRSQKIIPISQVSLASTLCSHGLFIPVAGAA